MMDATIESALDVQSVIAKATVKSEYGSRGGRATARFTGHDQAVRDAADNWARGRFGASVGTMQRLPDGTCMIDCIDYGAD